MNEEKDQYKIKVDERTGRMIAQTICAEIKRSFDENKKFYVLAERCKKQLNQVTRWMELGKECDSPWPGAADYFIPLTEWIVDAVHARVMNILFSQEPYMQARGEESSDVDKAPGITDFVDMIFREKIKLYDNTNYFFKMMINEPMAILKYDRVQEYDRVYSKEQALYFVNPATGEEKDILQDNPEMQMQVLELSANGWQPKGQREVWVTQDKEIIDGPQLEYVHFNDYAWAGQTKRNCRPYWEGSRFWLTLNDMKLKAKQDVFIKETVDKIAKEKSHTDKEGSEKAIAERGEKIEAFHWYGRLPFNKSNEVDFSDPEAIEQEVYCAVDYKDQELLKICHWYHRRYPKDERVYLRGMFEESDEFWGRSLAEKLYMTQKEINQLHNTIMNNAWIAMMKIFVKKRTLTGEDWERPTVYPGALWEEDQTGDIRALEVGDVKSIGLEIEATLLNFAERISNISVFQTGTARQEGGNKTLGEVEKTIAEGNVGLDKFLQRCHGILRKVSAWTVDYYYEHMPVGLERRIRGDSEEMIFPTPDNMPQFQQQGINPVWEQDDLAGQFDFIWSGTSLNSSRELNIAISNDLMSMYLPQPMVAGSMLATWDILRRGLVARNIKDWKNILPPKEAIIKEMQMMAMKAQAGQPAPSVNPQMTGKSNAGAVV